MKCMRLSDQYTKYDKVILIKQLFKNTQCTLLLSKDIWNNLKSHECLE